MFRKLCLLAVMATVCLGYAPLDAVAAVTSGSDEGYVVVNAPVVEHTAKFKNGREHDIFHAYGVMASDDPDSPFYRATYFTQGIVVRDPVGELGSVEVIRMVTPDGSANWVYLNSLYVDGPVEFYFANGSGKWHGIEGGGVFGPPERRTDGGWSASFEVKWEVDTERKQLISGPPSWDPPYPNKSKGFSFHALHITKETLDTGTGYILYENDQSGRNYMDDPDDPFHLTDGYYQGSTIKDLSGKVWSDVGIKGYTRSDGDTLWIIHSWWYHEGAGNYRLIGGTGPWRNMRGVGKTTGSERRIDPMNHLYFEFDWKMLE
jgi:hypothetical protein